MNRRPARAVLAMLAIGWVAGPVLGPGQGFAQTVAGPAAVQGESVQSIAVRWGDTLSAIVVGILPEGITLNQAMIAVFEANSRAFIAQNINLLRADATLRIPDPQVMARVDLTYANRLVRQHEADFASYRARLARQAAAAAPIPAPDAQSASGMVQAPSAPSVASIPSDQDRLVLSRPVEPAEGSGASAPALAQAAAEARSRALEEARVAREAALAEASSRISELERNVGELQQLLQLRNQVLSDTRDQLEQARREAAVSPSGAAESPAPAAPAPAPASAHQTAAPVDQAPALVVQSPSGADSATPAPSDSAAAAESPADSKGPADPTSPAAVAGSSAASHSPDPAPARPTLTERPIFWVTLVVLGLLAVFFVMRRRPEPLQDGESELARAVGPRFELPSLDLEAAAADNAPATSTTSTTSANPQSAAPNPNPPGGERS